MLLGDDIALHMVNQRWSAEAVDDHHLRIKHRHKDKDMQTQRIRHEYVSHVSIAQYSAGHAEEHFFNRI